MAERLQRPRAAASGAADEATRREDGLLRPLRHRAALHGGLDRGSRPYELVEVPLLERGRRDLLGDRRRAPRVLRGKRRGRGGQPVRAVRGGRDRRGPDPGLARRSLRQEATGGTPLTSATPVAARRLRRKREARLERRRACSARFRARSKRATGCAVTESALL